MADIRGSMRAMGERLLPSTPTPMREKIVPSSDWTEDSNGHYLLVDLPDFKKEEVRLGVNISAGHITISGERQVNGKKTEYFEQNFTLPPNSDVDKITGKFDGEILYVTVPTVATAVEEQRKEPETEYENVQGGAAAVTEPPQIEKNENVEGLRPKNEGEHGSNKVDGIKYGEIRKLLGEGNRHIFFSAEDIRKWEEEGGNIIRTAMEMLNKNKGIVMTAVVAFSLGMLVSRKFQSAGE
ncbi:inactive protein RESTRICTED TEV MOVEMENT 2-like [Pyrus ussuriensis x Pyrus communis]|uniref:Inactive protein RESTRICTED TEV MOVEMENT 2-like n=2 Tax=Pyrus TaxID=3766 RepID=A0A5N5I2Y2_9ROSA|nr:inactive protein RESTRICTED TEV MOVEMENT 2-like isoform X1 [Pyrus x bretschneideri]KAB2633483.1 inactive protein RESTRICTED TEV MOVEMENT 2-like [Pyrus ussuriensis x Pyrus communis]